MYVHNINPVFLEIFGLKIYYYGLMYALLFLSSYYLGRWFLKKRGENPDHTENLLVIAILAVIIGARLGHIFFYEWPYYSQHPMEILYIWEGGLASHGAAVALGLAVYFMYKITKIKLLNLTDLIVFGASLGVIFVRIGNFINGEIVGRVTNRPWGVVFPCNGLVRGQCGPELRHPVQLYESFSGLVIFLLMIGLMKNNPQLKPGLLTGVFLVGYFGMRFVLEFFKEYDGTLFLYPLTNGQLLSLPLIFLGFVFLWKNRK